MLNNDRLNKSRDAHERLRPLRGPTRDNNSAGFTLSDDAIIRGLRLSYVSG